MNVFSLRDRVIEDYENYVRSFVSIQDASIREVVDAEMSNGRLWPQPLLALNPAFEPGCDVDALCASGALHPDCARIFRRGKSAGGEALRFHLHQEQAINIAGTGAPYVLTTGTGSGKSLAYMVPIVDSILKRGSGRGVQAIIVYPMNALANSQMGELEKFLCEGFPDRRGPISFRRYTGQEKKDEREEIIQNPPDILLTNFVMLELMLTRKKESKMLRDMGGSLRWLVLDELHTYRGRQGSDVAVLVRRARELTSGDDLQCVGTSATIAGTGTRREQRAQVARVASQLFGVEVSPDHIIGETLRRTTPERDFSLPAQRDALRARLENDPGAPLSFAAMEADPLASWIESTFGVTNRTEDGETFLVRARPAALGGDEGTAAQLAHLTGMARELCEARARTFLLESMNATRNPHTGAAPFAFRLHQWVSRGDTVYATFERPANRHFTLEGQIFAPAEERAKKLFPLAFCRECGHEFYTVWASQEGGHESFHARELLDTQGQTAPFPGAEAGFLYLSAHKPWPAEADYGQILERLPDSWLETKQSELRLKTSQKLNVPRPVRLDALGISSHEGTLAHWMASSLRFCPCCGVTYNSSQRSDFSKLSSLGNEGRSTATTVISLSLVAALREDPSLEPSARKLLSFTDNRQDASLQAGHFNDFVETSLLRAALYRACLEAGASGLRFDDLTRRVFEALGLPIEEYASNPSARFAGREDAERALRGVLGYRLYRDLRRGWRITSPNLEQCGLLEIDYLALDEICAADDLWRERHPLLALASPTKRREVGRVLCDVLRRELAIKVEFLNPAEQESLRSRAFQNLKAPPALWTFDEGETLEQARVAFPRGRQIGSDDSTLEAYVSARSNFGRFLRRALSPNEHLKVADLEPVLLDLFEALCEGGILERDYSSLKRRGPRFQKRDEDEQGFRLKASAILWRAGDGTRPFHDPLRTPQLGDSIPASGPSDPAAKAAGNAYEDHLRGLQAEDAPSLRRQASYALPAALAAGESPAMAAAHPAAKAAGNAYEGHLRGLHSQPHEGEALYPLPAALATGSERTNPFFTRFYQGVASTLGAMEAREHTAQVPYFLREDREMRFKDARLPVLYCSPTMELGVDIAGLNAVHLRNVPPTPANYAQRSGRAGRSGQAAIVWTYCTTGSPHDQYFFRRPTQMVAGAVAPPRLDLGNEELIRAHVHAIWLHETGADLGQSLRDVLDVGGENPSLELLPELRATLSNPSARERARERAGRVLDSIGEAATGAPWHSSQWLDWTLNGSLHAFERACERWISLFKAAQGQQRAQNRLANDASRSAIERDKAASLRREAENQLRLLLEVGDVEHSDFYTYRYFAAEGFLPGYNFPRLPLSAFIPASKSGKRTDEYLSRPRFLAISEFGPRAVIYHEGSRYVINKVLLAPASEGEERAAVATESFKRCGACGYGHPVDAAHNPDLCEGCGEALPLAWHKLLRMQNVSTVRRDKINSDEEERLKLGYQTITSVRWPLRDGQSAATTARVKRGETVLATLAFGQAATIWRINLGWRRRQDANRLGFDIDIERGFWEKHDGEGNPDPSDPYSKRIERVIPFVEDARNALIWTPEASIFPFGLRREEMATLASALKRGVLARYGLEESELAVEPLPDAANRARLLFYEAAEGGAGALKHLSETPDAFAAVAQSALEILHFDAQGEDAKRAPGARDDCAAACYDCLLSYGNQGEHALLDRFLVRDFLLEMSGATLESERVARSTEAVEAQLAPDEANGIPLELWRGCDSQLERRWLRALADAGLRFPNQAQRLFSDIGVQADFWYRSGAAIFIDGPHHDGERAREDDARKRAALEDLGVGVLVFRFDDDWQSLFAKWPGIFGAR